VLIGRLLAAKVNAHATMKGQDHRGPCEAGRATGARLTAAEQALRDSLIVAQQGAGGTPMRSPPRPRWTAAPCAECSPTARLSGEALLDRDPIDVTKQLAPQLTASAADFEAMASAYGDVNPAAAIGARKGADQARRTYTGGVRREVSVAELG